MNNRIKKSIGILSFVFILNSVNVYATPPPPVYEGEYNIQNNTETQYSMFPIPDDVYGRTQTVDTIVLTDDKGEEVPYFIVDKYMGESTVKESFKSALVYGDYEKVNPSYVFKVYKNGDRPLNYNNVKVNTNRETFSKTVSLFGSNDNVNFTPISTQNIYVIESENANNICFNEPINYEFLKIQVMTDEEGFELTDIEVSSDIVYTNSDFYKKEIQLNFYQKEFEDEKISEIEMFPQNLEKRQPIKLRFEVEDERFSREVTLKHISNVPNEYYTLAKTSSDMPEIYSDNLETLKYVLIENKDDKPLNITGIYATIIEKYVVFDNRGHENVKLNFNSYTEEPKQYDLSLTIEDDELDDNLKVVSTELSYINDWAECSDDEAMVNEDLILNVLLVVVVVVIGLLGFLNLRNKNK